MRSSATMAAKLSTSIDFRRQIEPLLQTNCGACHGPARTSGLSVLTAQDLLKGGIKAGPSIIPGHSKDSPILQYLEGRRSPRMPLGGTAPPGLTSLLARWIDSGAKVDGKPLHAFSDSDPWTPAGWPFRKPVKYPPPKISIQDAAWVRNPIDTFVLARLRAKGLHPAPEASRQVLIRRVTYDLLGLPPTPEEIQRFVTDRSPGAYEKLIDRLLASPHYGERWARHWLDLARYADSDGYEQDSERQDAWRYRDYVIRSFNQDKPYDRFIKEQIAGDEIWPHDPDAIIATGFLRNGPWDSLAFDKEARWNDLLTDMTDTTGSVFLGLTVGCARCHDHKYDPIPQKDYYQLQAFFAGAKLSDTPLPETAGDAGGPAPGAKPASIPVTAGTGARTAAVVSAPAQTKAPAPPAAPKPPDLPLAMAVTDGGLSAPRHFLLLRGDVHQPGQEVAPRFPSALAGDHTIPVITPPAGGKTTGRRTALAAWLVSSENPQTARVMVNRVWQYHFGRGIVDTTSDFGKNGGRPTHAKLLDWLASVFEAPVSTSAGSAAVDNGMYNCGWRLKKLQRLILTSSTYRQSTRFDPACSKVDPENSLLWRMNRQRLEGEEIRDAILDVGGRLNPTMGGPGVFPEVEKGVLDTGSTHKWGHSSPEETLRRTIYVFQRRSVVLPIVDVFDGADMSGACPRRTTTTIAPQALVLFNSDFSHEGARYLAERVAREAGAGTAARINRAFLIALGRHPSPTERQKCLLFLTRQEAIHRRTADQAAPQSPARTNDSNKPGAVNSSPLTPGNGSPDPAAEAALADLCHVLLNTNEFVYIE